MNVAITGATGFIGARLLARCLDEGHAVKILTRRSGAIAGLPPQVGIVRGDLVAEIPESLTDDVDILFHCAAELRDPQQMQAVNVGGTRKLIELARGRVGRWVQLSSVGAYGPCARGAITENSPEHPAGAYETSKAEADRMVADAGSAGAFSHSILRPAIVFGAGMPNRSLAQLIAMVERGWFFFIGPPGASANYVHVDNVVEALRLCASQPAAYGRTYNLSDQRSMEVFIATIANALGKPVPRARVPLLLAQSIAAGFGWIPGFPLTAPRVRALSNRGRYPVERIVQELGYRHAVSMEQGLEKLIAAWKSPA